MSVEEYRELKKFYSDEEIAQQNFIGMATLQRWKRTEGVRARPAVTEVARFLREGKNQTDLAFIYNRSQSAISQMLTDYGLNGRN